MSRCPSAPKRASPADCRDAGRPFPPCRRNTTRNRGATLRPGRTTDLCGRVLAEGGRTCDQAGRGSREARTCFHHALSAIRASDLAQRWRALLGRETVLYFQGERAAQHADIAALLELAEIAGDDTWRGQARRGGHATPPPRPITERKRPHGRGDRGRTSGTTWRWKWKRGRTRSQPCCGWESMRSSRRPSGRRLTRRSG